MKNKKEATKVYSVRQNFPKPGVLNNTTVDMLANNNEPIEVFPPEIFFKGKCGYAAPAVLAPNG